MATIFNQATLSIGGSITNSNTTEAEVVSGLSLTKTAINTTYGEGGSVVYTVTINNAGGGGYTNLTLTDNLGAYTLSGGGTAVPLTYVEGSIRYFLNGVLQPAPTAVGAGELTVSGIDLPADSTALFIYEANVNEFAPLAAGSTITNVAQTDGGIGVGIISDEATVGVNEEPRLSIAKAVCPAVITDNGALTYTIILQNLGNTPVIATDGAIISDLFNPVLSDITVTLNGEVLTEGVGYSYNEATGEFTTLDGVITVPAATYTVNTDTGAVTTTPGVTVLTVSGTV